jgi:hypothetical protein
MTGSIKIPTTYEEAIELFDNEHIVFDDFDILSLRNNLGYTVAHHMARKGHVFTDERVLDLSSNLKTTVRSIQETFKGVG